MLLVSTKTMQLQLVSRQQFENYRPKFNCKFIDLKKCFKIFRLHTHLQFGK